MEAYRVETTLQEDGKLTLHHLPFQAGEPVEIIILPRPHQKDASSDYPLRGVPIEYTDPTEPVALDDWEVLK